MGTDDAAQGAGSGIADACLCRGAQWPPRARSGASRRLLSSSDAAEAWETVVVGHWLDAEGSWRSAARVTDVAANLAGAGRAGHRGARTRRRALSERIGRRPPGSGRSVPSGRSLGDRRRAAVGIVGTRSATRYGLGVAAQLGAELAATGITVVSGLALGIDGAAHEGALAGWQASRPTSAPPIAVVGNLSFIAFAQIPGGTILYWAYQILAVGLLAAASMTAFQDLQATEWRDVAIGEIPEIIVYRDNVVRLHVR